MQEYAEKVSIYMNNQARKFQRIMAPEPLPSTFQIKTRQLTVFGEKVQQNKIDFSWTAERDYKRWQLSRPIQLKEIVLASNQYYSLSGIQLVFTDNISSPMFQTDEKNYKIPVQLDTQKEIAMIEARVDDYRYDNFINRIRMVDKEGHAVMDKTLRD